MPPQPNSRSPPMSAIARRTALATALTLAAGALLPWRAAHAIGPKPAPLNPPVKLTLGANTVPHVAPFQYIVAEAKPLGVDIELVKFARYADTRTALASGSIDAGSIGPADVPIALSQGIQTISGIMGVGEAQKFPIVHKGLTLTKWEDLVGKRIGIAPGSAVWFQFAATITEAAIPYNKLTTINMQGAGTAFLQALERGDIDLFIGWEPYESQAEQQGLGTRATALDYSKSKAVGAELGLVGVNRDYLAKQREAVKRLVWSYLSIQDRLNASKEALAQAISAYTGLPEPVATNVAKVTTLGQFLTLAQMQRQAAEFSRLGVLTRDVSADLGPYFETALVAEVTKG
jgi:sulfonate transport system substrate-binding protein